MHVNYLFFANSCNKRIELLLDAIQRLRLAHSCILARVLLHTGACVNAALLTYLLTILNVLEIV